MSLTMLESNLSRFSGFPMSFVSKYTIVSYRILPTSLCSLENIQERIGRYQRIWR